MGANQLNFTTLSRGPHFGIRIDMIDRAKKTIIDFEQLSELLPFFANSGIKFIELGNLNSFDHQTGRLTSIFAKEPDLIPLKYIAKYFPDFEEIGSINEFKQTLYGSIADGHSIYLPELLDFEKKHAYWLQDYACFSALSGHIGNKKFSEWPPAIRDHDRRAFEIVCNQLADRILVKKILQFLVHESCHDFVQASHQAGIYVSTDLETLCDEHSCEAWSHHSIFYLNQKCVPSVYVGLPPSKFVPEGVKSCNIPYRWQKLYDNRFEFFRKLFSIYEDEFDYVHVLHGYTFFHCWEIAWLEDDPKHGRWAPGKFDLFFGYMREHFKKISYIFDFNEPLFPKFELLVKRYSLLQSVILGEPTEHTFPDHDLSRPICMIRSKLCNKKVTMSDQARSFILKESTSSLRAIIESKIKVKIIHFDEICTILGAKRDGIVARPQQYAKRLKSALGQIAVSQPDLVEKNKAPTFLKKVKNLLKKRSK